MTRPRPVVALIAGCALVVVVNAVILGAAVWNRKGDSPAELTLTERELAVPEFREDESSGPVLSLEFASETPPSVQRLARRRRVELPAVTYPWLDRAKLAALGFRLVPPRRDPSDEHGTVSIGERPAFLVLEDDGDSWPRWLALREESLRKQLPEADAEALLALDRTMRSRLVPIDADRDADTLRRRYPDRTRFLVGEGLVRAVSGGSGEDADAWRGQIPALLTSDIRVPRELVPALAKFLPKETASTVFEREQKERLDAWPAPVAPRYRAVVAFGRRNEPWLVSVSEIPAD